MILIVGLLVPKLLLIGPSRPWLPVPAISTSLPPALWFPDAPTSRLPPSEARALSADPPAPASTRTSGVVAHPVPDCASRFFVHRALPRSWAGALGGAFRYRGSPPCAAAPSSDVRRASLSLPSRFPWPRAVPRSFCDRCSTLATFYCTFGGEGTPLSDH